MPVEEFLFRQNEFLIVSMLLLLLIGGTEIGFRRGRAVQTEIKESAKSDYWTLQTGVMGLLALLLAFTFSMAVSRYETRRQLLIDETNAIGSAYSLSRMLAEPYRSEVANLMDNYLACRLGYYSTALGVMGEEEVVAGSLPCIRLQKQLWSQAEGAVAKDPAPVPTGMFVSSLVDLCDVAGKRDAARLNHVPQPVLIFLLLVTILTVTLVGYGCGHRNQRHLAATTSVCLLISLVILVIMDLDQPRRGLITISQSPMLELRSTLR
ncbi:MAG: hypothetical protein ACLQAT_07195 [Candidatus Binataceae bacterium]